MQSWLPPRLVRCGIGLQLGVCSRFLTCVQALEVPRACRGLNTVLCNYRWTCRAVRWHMADLQLAIMQHNLRAWFPRFAAGFARQATSGIAVDLLSTKSGWGGGRCSLWPVPFPRPLQTRRKWHAFSPNTVHGRRTGTGGRAAALLPSFPGWCAKRSEERRVGKECRL